MTPFELIYLAIKISHPLLLVLVSILILSSYLVAYQLGANAHHSKEFKDLTNDLKKLKENK